MPEPDQSNQIKQYDINLMWINRTNDPTRELLFPGTREEIKARVLDSALGWAKQNPNATVNLWYDSQSSTPEALQRTQELIQDCSTEGRTVKLMDIRSLPIVSQNPEIFSGLLPVYFHVDLLKLIIVLNSIQQDGVDAAIFADLQVGDLRQDKERLTQPELFSEEKMKALQEYGMLLAGHSREISGAGGKGISPVENQYLQLIHHEKMLKALQYVINLNLTNASEFLRANHENINARAEHAQLLCNEVYFRTVLIHQLLTPNYPLDKEPTIETVRIGKHGTEVKKAEIDYGFLFTPPKKNIPEPQTFNLDGIARQGNSHTVTAADLQLPYKKPVTADKMPRRASDLSADVKLNPAPSAEEEKRSDALKNLQKQITSQGNFIYEQIRKNLSESSGDTKSILSIANILQLLSSFLKIFPEYKKKQSPMNDKEERGKMQAQSPMSDTKEEVKNTELRGKMQALARNEKGEPLYNFEVGKEYELSGKMQNNLYEALEQFQKNIETNKEHFQNFKRSVPKKAEPSQEEGPTPNDPNNQKKL